MQESDCELEPLMDGPREDGDASPPVPGQETGLAALLENMTRSTDTSRTSWRPLTWLSSNTEVLSKDVRLPLGVSSASIQTALWSLRTPQTPRRPVSFLIIGSSVAHFPAVLVKERAGRVEEDDDSIPSLIFQLPS